MSGAVQARGGLNTHAHSPNPKMTAVVIGAGIVGLHAALELQRRGRQVTVLDPGPPGGRQSASYGHGAWINPASIMPTSLPGLWKKVPGFLLDPTGPFYLSPFDLPRLAPWLVRFLLAGSNWDKIERCARLRYALCRSAVDEYLQISEEAGARDLIRCDGLLTVFKKRESFLAGKREAALREKLGLRLGELSADELRAREPHLSPDYTFATLIEEGAYLSDTAGYCQALAALFVRKGGRLLAAHALGFDLRAGRLVAVRTDNGLIPCSSAVLSAGVHSSGLARKLGDRVSMVSERGYHVQVDGAPVGPRHSVILSDGKIAISPQRDGFRAAGQVELAPVDKPPDWRRADIVLHHARRGMPALDTEAAGVSIDRWMGHRPSTPDGLPVIGRSRRCPEVLHAFGHGHAGPSMAPATARIIGALADCEKPMIDIAPYAAGRFRIFSRTQKDMS